MDEHRSHFLGVSQSILGRSWTDRLDLGTSRIATAIGQRTGLSDILARIVAARGVDVDAAESYLQPTLRDLMPDPSTLDRHGRAGGAAGQGDHRRGADRAVRRLRRRRRLLVRADGALLEAFRA